MNDYYQRGEITPVERSSPRVAAIVAVSPRATTSDSRRTAPPAVAADVATVVSTDDDAAGAAEYARVHARIADILANLRSETSTTTIDGAANAIQAMLPAPIILVPLPPASKEAIEHAAALAKKIAEQAVYAHAAQAHVTRGTVDQMLTGAA